MASVLGVPTEKTKVLEVTSQATPPAKVWIRDQAFQAQTDAEAEALAFIILRVAITGDTVTQAIIAMVTVIMAQVAVDLVHWLTEGETSLA